MENGKAMGRAVVSCPLTVVRRLLRLEVEKFTESSSFKFNSRRTTVNGQLTTALPIAVLLLTLCTCLLAQDQPAPFNISVGTRLIIQTVSVTDKDGKPIEGLTKDDFVLTE